MMNVEKNVQLIILFIGFIFVDFFIFFIIGKIIIIKIDDIRAMIPPSLLGIDRKIE